MVARTPPSRASYHRFGNALFEQALRVVCSQEHAMCVVLPRHREQRAAIAALELRHCIVPDGAVDARALMYRADLVLGAGGTMTREAALLGIPTYTLFAGRASAVDAWLIARGLLRRLTWADELAALHRRASSPRPLAELAERAEAIREAFAQTTVAAAS